MNDSAYTQVPVDDSGSSLFLPDDLLCEVLDSYASREKAQQRSQAEARIDFPITGLPSGNRSSLQVLGNQPSHEVLLDNIKGWNAIAGWAVSQRVRGLSKHLHVFSNHVVKGKLETREQPDHRLTGLLLDPNPVFTIGDMLWLLTWHLQQVGEGYWQKINDGIGKPTQLWPLPPGLVTPVPDDEVGIAGYMVRDGKGGEFALGLDEVIRFWNPDPNTMYSSIGRLGPQATEYDQARFMEDHVRQTFEEHAVPRMAIVGKAEQAAIEPNVQRAFHRKWRQMFNTRVGTARSLPAFIPAGWDIKELTSQGVANEVVPLKEVSQQQLLAAFGVPGTVVGMDKNVNRATAEALDYIFDKNTITHYTDLISEGLSVRLAKDFDNKLQVGFTEFVAPDKEHQLKQEKQDLDEAVRSVQQVLRDRNMDPKDAPWGEKPILPFTLSPYDGDFTVEKRVEQIGAQGLQGSGSVSGADGRQQPVAKASRRGAVATYTRDDPMDVEAAQRRAIAHEKKFVGPLSSAVLRVLRSQRLDILERLQALDPKEMSLPVDVTSEPRQRAAVQRAVSEAIAKQLFDPDEWDEVFARLVFDHLAEPFAAAANDATATVSKEQFVFSAFAQETIDTQVFKLAGQVDDTTLRKVQDAVQHSLDSGQGVAGVIKQLEGTFGRKRARVIARTEVLTAVQEGQVQGWRSTGQVEGKQWNISGNNTRDTHAATDGQRVALAADFVLGDGERANAPGDTTLTPGNRVNCQCFLSPVIIGA